MKLSILEPLGLPQARLRDMVEQGLGNGIHVDYYDTRVEDTQTLIQRSRDADMVMLSNFKFGREVMEHCPNLKMICVAFTGFDHIDMEYCRANNIVVSNCSGYATTAVTELVFGLIIALYRNIIPCDTITRKAGTKDGLVGFELSGKKFGVVGVGAIGKAVIDIAKAFGCSVYANNAHREINIEAVINLPLDQLLAQCDIISLHTPLNDSTKALINKDKLALMKKSAILINTARGAIVDNRALADSLNSGEIAGAGIDVFDEEPPIPTDYPLLNAKNTVVTPHIAFATAESMVKRGVIAVENIKMWLEGNPQNVVK